MAPTAADTTLRERAWAAAASVCDPEIPVLGIADLGVLRDIRIENGVVEAIITPTYSGCPAMNMIALEIEVALENAGFARPKVTTVLSPAWTTDWKSRSRESAQDDKWNFCLTAGTLCPANQERP